MANLSLPLPVHLHSATPKLSTRYSVISFATCAVFPVSNMVLTFQQPTLTLLLWSRRKFSAYRHPKLSALVFKHHVTCFMAVFSLMTQDLLLSLNCCIEFCSKKVFYGVGVLAPRSNTQKPGGPVVFCRGFLSISHRFRLFGDAGQLALATVTRLPKHSKGLRWRGHVTCNFSSRACSLAVGNTQHLWGEHWWHLLTSPRLNV